MNVAGIHLPDLPDDVTPLEAAVTIKALSADGTVTLYERVSDTLTSWEALGMLTTFADSVRASLRHINED